MKIADEIDGGREDYSNLGGVSRLCMYSSAAHISLRQGCRDADTPECCIVFNNSHQRQEDRNLPRPHPRLGFG